MVQEKAYIRDWPVAAYTVGCPTSSFQASAINFLIDCRNKVGLAPFSVVVNATEVVRDTCEIKTTWATINVKSLGEASLTCIISLLEPPALYLTLGSNMNSS